MSRSGVQISVQDLTHRYSSRGPVTFDQVNLESTPGEVLAIIGRSGCGKSTLLHIMAGLLAPSSGSIRLNDVEIKEPSPKWVMMFQAPHLFPWMQVSQNVGIGLKFASFAEDKIRERQEEDYDLVWEEACRAEYWWKHRSQGWSHYPGEFALRQFLSVRVGNGAAAAQIELKHVERRPDLLHDRGIAQVHPVHLAAVGTARLFEHDD